MAQKKPKLPKFTGELAKRIKTLPAQILTVDSNSGKVRLMTEQELCRARNDWLDDLAAKQFVKIPSLLRHYGWKGEGENLDGLSVGTLLAVLMCMAADFVPGFQTDRNVGRPPKHDAKSQNALLVFIDVIKKCGLATTDLEACEVWAECQDTSLAGPGRASDRQKRARSIQNLVSAARASQKRKASIN